MVGKNGLWEESFTASTGLLFLFTSYSQQGGAGGIGFGIGAGIGEGGNGLGEGPGMGAAESVPVVEDVQPALKPEPQESMRLRNSLWKRHVIAPYESFLHERWSLVIQRLGFRFYDNKDIAGKHLRSLLMGISCARYS